LFCVSLPPLQQQQGRGTSKASISVTVFRAIAPQPPAKLTRTPRPLSPPPKQPPDNTLNTPAPPKHTVPFRVPASTDLGRVNSSVMLRIVTMSQLMASAPLSASMMRIWVCVEGGGGGGGGRGDGCNFLAPETRNRGTAAHYARSRLACAQGAAGATAGRQARQGSTGRQPGGRPRFGSRRCRSH
jgi:hypothetical protein